jgi:hypothetical protein
MNHQSLRSLLFRLFLLIGLLTSSNFGSLGIKTTSAQVSDHKNSTVQLVQSTTQEDLCQYKINDIEKRICMLEIKAQEVYYMQDTTHIGKIRIIGLLCSGK